MRLRNDKEAPNKLEDSNLLITKNQYPIILKPTDVVEIGMGKGEMITQLAQANQDINYYGLEKFATVAAKCIKKAKEYELKNFKIILEDAKEIENIFKGTCGTIWLTFSDPWPKVRHFKRRLTYKDFLEKYKLIMNKDTILKFKSDNDKLYEFSLESFKENDWEIIDHGKDLHASKYAKDNVMTGYEVKWSNAGKNINFIFTKLKNK
ncbi:tRNA (guanosine(46)-N7)-methyltransferase TrmB [Mycoplasmopsis caviae]|uniref:tRNA (guanine-N(7)-)-methyltransferase n=1 Tax=Mycoplasmopsis caviae TaxID=55603 RepID=A0A3P8K955_9BACT|nr:tRNA (guanosine(46)-N7)-methyltransferase TrmB [Mycoplasmopsis caviae]UUD35303.1 tRNA (guanosine(46)-N7)-methyltransferase TrmB [Mycoplasmopsis caviae]VDR41919.1 tRNA (guanine-N(7)-)-methyltransferase [Mycoplasmopsis caviae]